MHRDTEKSGNEEPNFMLKKETPNYHWCSISDWSPKAASSF